MRIQPHVLSKKNDSDKVELIKDILLDTIITHGNPVGWVGAVFHGLVLKYASEYNRCPAPLEWFMFEKDLKLIAEICNTEPLLKEIWTPTWERLTKLDLDDSVNSTICTFFEEVELINKILDEGPKKVDLLEERQEKQYNRLV